MPQADSPDSVRSPSTGPPRACSHAAPARCWACVDLSAIAHNLRRLRSRLSNNARLTVMVKANGYGHGAVEVARAALAAGAEGLGVARLSEGLELRSAGLSAPIRLSGPCLEDEFQAGIEAGLVFTVCSEDEIRALAARARAFHQGLRLGGRTKVQLLLDTGMGRGGFGPEELGSGAARVCAERTLELEGVFSHFTSAEEPDPAPVREQTALFRRAVEGLERLGIRIPLKHLANSAATLFHPETHLDLVRCGLAVYGLRDWPKERDRLDLRPALSLHTRIAHLARRPAGWAVGYNRTHLCRRDSWLATLAAGYGDGYPRSLSNRGQVLIRGRRCPILGRISMDYLTVDLTDLVPAAGLPERGEEATLIGEGANGERITVEELARGADSSPYLITTQLPAQLERRCRGSAGSEAQSGEGVRMELRGPPTRTLPVLSVALRGAAKEGERNSRRKAAGA